jgi:hypothetical protein
MAKRERKITIGCISLARALAPHGTRWGAGKLRVVGLSGVSHATLARWQNGTSTPNLAGRLACFSAFGVAPGGWLITGDELDWHAARHPDW